MPIPPDAEDQDIGAPFFGLHDLTGRKELRKGAIGGPTGGGMPPPVAPASAGGGMSPPVAPASAGGAPPAVAPVSAGDGAAARSSAGGGTTVRRSSGSVSSVSRAGGSSIGDASVGVAYPGFSPVSSSSSVGAATVFEGVTVLGLVRSVFPSPSSPSLA